MRPTLNRGAIKNLVRRTAQWRKFMWVVVATMLAVIVYAIKIFLDIALSRNGLTL